MKGLQLFHLLEKNSQLLLMVSVSAVCVDSKYKKILKGKLVQ